MARIIKEAKRGDGVAMRLCMERLVPIKAARDRAVELEVPASATAADLVTAAASVIDQAARGVAVLRGRRLARSLSTGSVFSRCFGSSQALRATPMP